MRVRPWQRLGLRLAALFVVVVLLAIGLVGGLVYERQKGELEETLAALLLNIARTGALLVDPALHREVERGLERDSPAYRRLRTALAAVQDENGLDTPIYTLADYREDERQARFMVTSRGPGAPGEPYPLVPALLGPLGRAFRDGVATRTSVYHNQSGTWITAFAPIRDGAGRVVAVLDVDYRVDVYMARLAALRATVLYASLASALAALVIGLTLARRITGPLSALTSAVARVAAGELSRTLAVRSRDEVGALTAAFNEMLAGLRQRDFIRDTFGRYVSPEVARAILDSPEGRRLGGEKREVSILMADLRGYTRFAEQGDPARVMEVLNGYLGRMTDVVIAHGGIVNEFIGDAVFAIFGAPLPLPDHAERAAAAALGMQRAMAEINQVNAERGLPRFEMGVGVNTGEAVVGNVGSEQRAKYAVVGGAVNLAARVEGCTVGGQVFLSAGTYGRIRDLVEVAPPVAIEVKGIADPLLLYELRAIGGRFAQRLPDIPVEVDRQVDVALPLVARVIESKTVGAATVAGVAVRLGLRLIDARLEAPLAPLTDVRFRLGYPGLGYDSGDLYGKVVGEVGAGGDPVTRIRFTSVDPVDQKILAQFLEP